MNSHTLSPQKRKTLKLILVIILVVLLVVVIKKHSEKMKLKRAVNAAAYEALKAPEGSKNKTPEEINREAYEALKAPSPKN